MATTQQEIAALGARVHLFVRPEYRELREAGIREFRHPGSTHVYFSAPGGQVFRLIDMAYDGP
jgi:hypothetical protein